MRAMFQPSNLGNIFMITNIIKDWDDAYANMPNIPDGESYPERWAEAAAAFRGQMADRNRFEESISYGPGERNTFDLFHAENSPRGLFVFIHGGYWMRFFVFLKPGRRPPCPRLRRRHAALFALS